MKNGFLNEDLVEEVYMDIPPRVEDKFSKGNVCKLRNLSMALNNRLGPGSKDLQGF